MDLGIDSKVALVTGASKGIGLGIATALAAEGARVAMSSRSRERIDAAAKPIGAHAFVHDSGDVDAAPALVGAVEAALGPVEILVVNTGGPPVGPDPLGFTREQWEAAYRELVLAPIALIERVIPGMRERGWGRVINVSSTAVREPIPAIMLSNTHRSATLAAFKTLARQLAGDGITFNTLLTGASPPIAYSAPPVTRAKRSRPPPPRTCPPAGLARSRSTRTRRCSCARHARPT